MSAGAGSGGTGGVGGYQGGHFAEGGEGGEGGGGIYGGAGAKGKSGKGKGTQATSKSKSWAVTQGKSRTGQPLGPKTVTTTFTKTSAPATTSSPASEGALALSKSLIGKYGSVIGNPKGPFIGINIGKLGLATFGYALANTGGYTPGVPGPQGSPGLPATYEQLMAMDERSRPSKLNYPELYKIPPVTSAGPPTIPDSAMVDPAMVDLGESRIINALSFQTSQNLLLSEEEEMTTLGGF